MKQLDTYQVALPGVILTKLGARLLNADAIARGYRLLFESDTTATFRRLHIDLFEDFVPDGYEYLGSSGRTPLYGKWL